MMQRPFATGPSATSTRGSPRDECACATGRTPLLRLLALGLFVLLGGLASPLAGQVFDPAVRFTIPTTVTGEPVRVLLDHTIPLDGWSLGLCADPAELTIISASEGLDLLQFDGGNGPAFHDLTVTAGGVTSAMLTSTTGVVTLVPGSAREVLVLDVQTQPTTSVTADLTWCDSLGNPPVALEVQAGGRSVTPYLEDGVIITAPPSPLFVLDLGTEFGVFDPMTGAGGFSMPVHLSDWYGTAPTVLGFRCGLVHPASLVEPTFVEIAPALQQLNGGLGPEFFTTTFLQSVGTTFDVVFDTNGVSGLLTPTDVELCRLHFLTISPSLTGVTSAVQVEVTFDPTLPGAGGTIGARIDLGGGGPGPSSATPVLIEGSAILLPNGAFRRGDCNGDTSTDIADALAILGSLFGGALAVCDTACDVNDDGGKNIADAIALLTFLFNAGPPPPAPFPACGVDLTPGGLECTIGNGC